MPPPTRPVRTDFLSPAQAGRLLGVSSFTVQRWLDSGRLSGTYTSLGRLIDAASVHAVAAERAAAEHQREPAQLASDPATRQGGGTETAQRERAR